MSPRRSRDELGVVRAVAPFRRATCAAATEVAAIGLGVGSVQATAAMNHRTRHHAPHAVADLRGRPQDYMKMWVTTRPAGRKRSVNNAG
jgi:hypothetical protein